MVAFLPRLRRFCRALTGNDHNADDLAQSTVERALNNLDRWQRGSRLDSWMFRIAKNLWIDQLRSSKSRGPYAEQDHLLELSGEDGRQVAEAQLMLRKTETHIAALPEEQRAVVALILIDGLPYKDAAEILEVPIGTVMSRLSRARKTLAEQLLPGGET